MHLHFILYRHVNKRNFSGPVSAWHVYRSVCPVIDMKCSAVAAKAISISWIRPSLLNPPFNSNYIRVESAHPDGLIACCHHWRLAWATLYPSLTPDHNKITLSLFIVCMSNNLIILCTFLLVEPRWWFLVHTKEVIRFLNDYLQNLLFNWFIECTIM